MVAWDDQATLNTSKMTIGDHLKRKGRQSAVAVGFVFLLVFICPVLLPRTALPGVLYIAGFIALANLVFVMAIKCPRCNKWLGDAVAQGSMPYHELPDRCPRCDVSFNEPLPDNR
jgi:hypothetical protein